MYNFSSESDRERYIDTTKKNNDIFKSVCLKLSNKRQALVRDLKESFPHHNIQITAFNNNRDNLPRHSCVDVVGLLSQIISGYGTNEKDGPSICGTTFSDKTLSDETFSDESEDKEMIITRSKACVDKIGVIFFDIDGATQEEKERLLQYFDSNDIFYIFYTSFSDGDPNKNPDTSLSRFRVCLPLSSEIEVESFKHYIYFIMDKFPKIIDPRNDEPERVFYTLRKNPNSIREVDWKTGIGKTFLDVHASLKGVDLGSLVKKIKGVNDVKPKVGFTKKKSSLGKSVNLARCVSFREILTVLSENNPNSQIRYNDNGNRLDAYCPFHQDNKPSLIFYINDGYDGYFKDLHPYGESGSIRKFIRIYNEKILGKSISPDEISEFIKGVGEKYSLKISNSPRRSVSWHDEKKVQDLTVYTTQEDVRAELPSVLSNFVEECVNTNKAKVLIVKVLAGTGKSFACLELSKSYNVCYSSPTKNKIVEFQKDAYQTFDEPIYFPHYESRLDACKRTHNEFKDSTEKTYKELEKNYQGNQEILECLSTDKENTLKAYFNDKDEGIYTEAVKHCIASGLNVYKTVCKECDFYKSGSCSDKSFSNRKYMENDKNISMTHHKLINTNMSKNDFNDINVVVIDESPETVLFSKSEIYPEDIDRWIEYISDKSRDLHYLNTQVSKNRSEEKVKVSLSSTSLLLSSLQKLIDNNEDKMSGELLYEWLKFNNTNLANMISSISINDCTIKAKEFRNDDLSAFKVSNPKNFLSNLICSFKQKEICLNLEFSRDSKGKKCLIIHEKRDISMLSGKPIIILDATCNEFRLKSILGLKDEDIEVYNPQLKPQKLTVKLCSNSNLRFQDSGMNTFTQTSMTEGDDELSKNGDKVKDFIIRVARSYSDKKIVVFTPLKVENALRKELKDSSIKNVTLTHYFKERGINEYKDYSICILTTPAVNLEQIEMYYNLIKNEYPHKNDISYQLKPTGFIENGKEIWIESRNYENELLKSLFEMKREEEMIQNLYRIRPNQNEAKTVYLLSNVSLKEHGIEPDELINISTYLNDKPDINSYKKMAFNIISLSIEVAIYNLGFITRLGIHKIAETLINKGKGEKYYSNIDKDKNPTPTDTVHFPSLDNFLDHLKINLSTFDDYIKKIIKHMRLKTCTKNIEGKTTKIIYLNDESLESAITYLKSPDSSFFISDIKFPAPPTYNKNISTTVDSEVNFIDSHIPIQGKRCINEYTAIIDHYKQQEVNLVVKDKKAYYDKIISNFEGITTCKTIKEYVSVVKEINKTIKSHFDKNKRYLNQRSLLKDKLCNTICRRFSIDKDTFNRLVDEFIACRHEIKKDKRLEYHVGFSLSSYNVALLKSHDFNYTISVVKDIIDESGCRVTEALGSISDSINLDNFLATTVPKNKKDYKSPVHPFISDINNLIQCEHYIKDSFYKIIDEHYLLNRRCLNFGAPEYQKLINALSGNSKNELTIDLLKIEAYKIDNCS